MEITHHSIGDGQPCFSQILNSCPSNTTKVSIVFKALPGNPGRALYSNVLSGLYTRQSDRIVCEMEFTSLHIETLIPFINSVEGDLLHRTSLMSNMKVNL